MDYPNPKLHRRRHLAALVEKLSPAVTSDFVEIWDSVSKAFAKVKLSNLIPASTPPGALQPYAGIGSTAPSGWLFCDGTAVSRATYPLLYAALNKTDTVTTPIASPGKVNWTAHDRQNNDPVKFSVSGGSLPTGITAGTTYYVKNKTANDFEIASSPGGTSINFTGSSTGTQTGIHAPHGNGDGSTTFNLPDGRARIVTGRDTVVGGSAANRITSGGSGIFGDSPGASGGADTLTQTSGQIASHAHDPGTLGFTEGSGKGGSISKRSGLGSNAVTVLDSGSTASAGSGTAMNKMNPVLIVQAWIIKT